MFDAWMSITMLIEVEGVGLGTGFLIRPSFQTSMPGIKALKFFVVTAKHVLGENRLKLRSVTLYPTVGFARQTMREVLDIPLQGQDGASLVFEHVDPEVDIALIEVTDQIIHNTLIQHDAPDVDAFHMPGKSAPNLPNFGIGTPVAIVGYPGIETGSGLTAQQYTEPIVYFGTTSTLPDKPYIQNGKPRRGFLINSTAIPGQSGSPVILDPRMPLVVGTSHYIGQTTPPYLVGVLTETTFAPVKASNYEQRGFGGAAFVYSAQTIMEIAFQAIQAML